MRLKYANRASEQTNRRHCDAELIKYSKHI